MTAEVALPLASYPESVTIPVSSVLQTEEGCFCCEKVGQFIRQLIIVGDGNEIFLLVEQGLVETWSLGSTGDHRRTK